MGVSSARVAATLAAACLVLAGSSAASERTPVATLTGGRAPAWSPDGTQIAYVGPGFMEPGGSLNQLRVATLDGGGTRVISSFQAGAQLVNEVRFASSRRIVFDVVPDGLLERIDPPSGRAAQIGSVVLLSNPQESFDVSADGRTVAFTGSARSLTTSKLAVDAVGVVPSGGGHARVLPKPRNADDEQPSLSPDGRQLVFARVIDGATRPSQPSLLVEATSGGAPRRLGVEGNWPQWSPNGRYIAYLGRYHFAYRRLEVVPAAGGSPRVLASNATSLSWSPDSTRLVYSTNTALHTVTLGGKMRRLSLGPLLIGYETPQWSPDGTRIAFTAIRPSDRVHTRVYVVNADGTGLHRIA
jgi:Tol biopolymer transport system component